MYTPDKKALLANLRDGVLDDSSTAALTYGRRGRAVSRSAAPRGSVPPTTKARPRRQQPKLSAPRRAVA